MKCNRSGDLWSPFNLGGGKLKSLYIHIPFCKSKCYYCDFNSYSGKDYLIEKYVEALKCELKNTEHEFKTVYFGGGTPSNISSKYIKEIMHIIKCDGEITLELNPGTITREKLLDYKQCGINRLSIGLQATQNDLLKRIGRIHTLEEFEEAFFLAREVGFNNISVDLMFGLPGQTVKNVKESLEYILGINPEHISCYSLIVHDELIDKHPEAFKDLPSDEIEREMYHLICSRLKESGYVQYEISNFAKSGFESKHNLCYWNQDEYYGIGAGASSYVDNVRYKNIDSIENYIVALNDGYYQDYQIIEETQNIESKLKEYMILRFRLLEGISINEAMLRFNINILDEFKEELKKLTNLELIEIQGDYIRLTSKGLDLANVVWEEFV